MVSSLHSLSSTFSLLNPLSTLTYLKTLKQHRKQLITCSSLASKSHCSRSTKSILPKSSEQDLVVLGIETSCDDTAAAVVRSNGEILSQVVSSQADLLVRFGGVAPKMAEEAHSQAIDQVVQEALDKANLTPRDLSAVAVTIGPGLSLCLRVGVRKARKVAGSFNLPIVGVHHMEAHALVVRLTERELQFPFLVLLVSGGHNLLILAHGLGQYLQLGTTIDDAVGEAYDKSAKWLGLDISKSGGPAIEQLAKEGDAESIKFSVPMRHHKDCNFSYAGLKNQVRLAIESKKINAEIPISSASSQDRSSRADIAASFQRVAVLHLEDRCKRAIDWALKIEPSIKHLVVSGGVASNQYVRARLNEVVKKNNLQLVCPPPSLCTDNGVMVAWTGIEHFRMGRFDPPPPKDEPEDFVYDLRPRWPLGEEHTEGRSEARSMRTARIHPSLTSIIQQGSMQSPSSSHSNHRRSSVSYRRLLHNGPDTIEELLDRHVVKKEKSLDDEEEELLNRRRIATTRREALSLYRDILRATRFFIWPDSRGVLWRDVLRDNARKEFDAARFETDPEIVTRLLIGGRDAVQSALDKLAEKHRQQIDKERGGGDRR